MAEVCFGRGWRLVLVRCWPRNSVLGDGKLTLAQANCQAMGMAQLQEVSEMLNMRG